MKGDAMARCGHCGNDYDKAFELTIGGTTHVFDSFECAIHAVAPRCAHCAQAIRARTGQRPSERLAVG
jgi:hypothetical protein